MKKNIHLILILLALPFYSQHLYFEQSNGTDVAFAAVDVVEQFSGSLRANIMSNNTFDKTEGWELVAVDQQLYYYQITDENSNNFGQIDYWNIESNVRTNYGSLNDIFDTPMHWKLGGVDKGILYFSSDDTNSEIVSWNGSEIVHFAFLNEVVASTHLWRLAGFYDGNMYIEWTNDSYFNPSIRAYDGTTQTADYNNTDYYTNYYDAYLCGVSEYVISDNTPLLSSLQLVKDHINGDTSLSANNFTEILSSIETDAALLATDLSVMELAFEIIELYDAKFGGLFTEGNRTFKGFARADSGFEFEHVILEIMQSIMDYAYTQENLETYPNLFANYLFASSSYFPGAVAPPENAAVNYTVKINGDQVEIPGTPPNYVTEDARRPTGCYLAPGSVAKVTVPASLVGVGASVLVGAHTWDNFIKPNILRMDRVFKKYEINSTTLSIANPLGGGVYINIPYHSSLGIIDVTIENVVRSPYFANTVANQTTLSDWQNNQRNYQAPWADFETDKVMHQVPTSWIYNVEDPSIVLDDWDLAMDGVSEMLGRPLVRAKTVAYQQVDLQFRGSAFFPGYPQANITYDPTMDYGGNHNHFLINGPRDIENSGTLNVFFHELGHAEQIYKFNGEIEAFVNFLHVGVYNKKFGMDLDTAFIESSTTGVEHTLDEAAISWMIAENFRLGNEMSLTTGENRQEFSYQPRGYAKYVDVVDLFGWEALENFYITINEDYDAGNYESSNLNVNNVTTDSRVLRMSEAAGYDLRPLMHFWGKHPDNFEALANSIVSGELPQSAAIYDKLQHYKDIVPMTNAAFREFGLNDYSEGKILTATTVNDANISQSYTESFIRKFWETYDGEEGEAAAKEIDHIIDLYFPDGRPDEIEAEVEEEIEIEEVEEAEEAEEMEEQEAEEVEEGEEIAEFEEEEELEELEENQVILYPNPTDSIFTIQGASNATIEVYDVLGKLLISKLILTDREEIDLSNLQSALYYVKIFHESQLYIKGIVKN